MSVSFRATALIGVELDKSKTYKMIKERGCEHEASKDKFCAQCGETMWDEREVIIDELCCKEEGEDEYYTEDVILECYRLAFTTDEHRIFLGKSISVWSGNWGDDKEAKMIGLPVMEEISQDIAYIKQALLEFLMPLNLWDESKFGIWTIANVSY